MIKEYVLILVLILGVAGTFIPFLPGIPIMFLGILIYSIFDSWTHFSPTFILIIAFITCITFFIDYLGTYWGVKKFGASRYGIWVGIIGGILGIFSLGPLGLIMGSVLGVIIGELLAGKNFTQSLKASLGSILGILGSALIQFFIALIILFWSISKIY